MKEKPFTLDNAPMLERYGLQASELQGLKIKIFDEGDYLCMEGQKLNDLLIVLSGSAKAYVLAENGKRLLLHFYQGQGLETESLIGEMELIRQTSCALTSITAVETVCCIAIPLKSNEMVLLKNNTFLLRLGKSIADKLNRQTRSNAINMLYPVDARLCSYIELTARGNIFHEKLTDVADLLGTSYRHLLRILENLCSRHILTKTSAGYTILDRKALNQIGKGFYDPD